MARLPSRPLTFCADLDERTSYVTRAERTASSIKKNAKIWSTRWMRLAPIASVAETTEEPKRHLPRLCKYEHMHGWNSIRVLWQRTSIVLAMCTVNRAIGRKHLMRMKLRSMPFKVAQRRTRIRLERRSEVWNGKYFLPGHALETTSRTGYCANLYRHAHAQRRTTQVVMAKTVLLVSKSTHLTRFVSRGWKLSCLDKCENPI